MTYAVQDPLIQPPRQYSSRALLPVCALASVLAVLKISSGPNAGTPALLVTQKDIVVHPLPVPTAAGPGAFKCADEGGDCVCTGVVVFGATNADEAVTEEKWTAPRMVSGSIGCSKFGFGEDPYPAHHKECYCRSPNGAEHIAVVTTPAPVSASGLPSVAKAVAYKENNPGYLDGAGTSWQALSFWVDENGAMTTGSVHEAISTGSCAAAAKDGRTVTGKMQFDDLNGEDAIRHGFGQTISYAYVKCTFDEPVDPMKGGRMTLGKTGAIDVTLRQAFAGQPKGLAMCHPAVFGDYAADKVMAVWTAYLARQNNDRPMKMYSFDVRKPELRALHPVPGATEVNIPLEALSGSEHRKGREHGKELTDASTQPYYMAQWAWVKECHLMAKYDGFKWAGFMDNDELPTLTSGSGLSLIEYLETKPADTQAVVIQRQEIIRLKDVPMLEGFFAQDPKQVQIAQWAEHGASKSEPPKFFKRVDIGQPGKIHEPCANQDLTCPQHVSEPNLDEVLLRHIPMIRDFDMDFLSQAAALHPTGMPAAPVGPLSLIVDSDTKRNGAYTDMFKNKAFEQATNDAAALKSAGLPAVMTPILQATSQADILDSFASQSSPLPQPASPQGASALLNELDGLLDSTQSVAPEASAGTTSSPVATAEAELASLLHGPSATAPRHNKFEVPPLPATGFVVPPLPVAAPSYHSWAESTTASAATPLNTGRLNTGSLSTGPLSTGPLKTSASNVNAGTGGNEAADAMHAARDAVKSEIAAKVDEVRKMKKSPEFPRLAAELEVLKQKLHDVGQHKTTGLDGTVATVEPMAATPAPIAPPVDPVAETTTAPAVGAQLVSSEDAVVSQPFAGAATPAVFDESKMSNTGLAGLPTPVAITPLAAAGEPTAAADVPHVTTVSDLDTEELKAEAAAPDIFTFTTPAGQQMQEPDLITGISAASETASVTDLNKKEVPKSDDFPMPEQLEGDDWSLPDGGNPDNPDINPSNAVAAVTTSEEHAAPHIVNISDMDKQSIFEQMPRMPHPLGGAIIDMPLRPGFPPQFQQRIPVGISRDAALFTSADSSKQLRQPAAFEIPPLPVAGTTGHRFEVPVLPAAEDSAKPTPMTEADHYRAKAAAPGVYREPTPEWHFGMTMAEAEMARAAAKKMARAAAAPTAASPVSSDSDKHVEISDSDKHVKHVTHVPGGPRVSGQELAQEQQAQQEQQRQRIHEMMQG